MDIHVLTGDGKRDWVIVFHFPVPDANNSVGVNYRLALVNSALGGATRMSEGNGPGQVTTAEKAAIEAGGVYEQRVSFRVEGNGDNTDAIRVMLRRKYTRDKTLVLAKLQSQLKYFGHTESEV